jgi:hypothetical protein
VQCLCLPQNDSTVPPTVARNLRLGIWINSQRVGKRKLDRGEPCKGMTGERAARLTRRSASSGTPQ